MFLEHPCALEEMIMIYAMARFYADRNVLYYAVAVTTSGIVSTPDFGIASFRRSAVVGRFDGFLGADGEAAFGVVFSAAC